MGYKTTEEDFTKANALATKITDLTVDAKVPRFSAYMAITMSAVNLLEETFGTAAAIRLGDCLHRAFLEADSKS